MTGGAVLYNICAEPDIAKKSGEQFDCWAEYEGNNEADERAVKGRNKHEPVKNKAQIEKRKAFIAMVIQKAQINILMKRSEIRKKDEEEREKEQ